jgi:predicted aspartyl protease
MKVINCFHSTFGSQMEPAPAVQAYCYIIRLNTGFWVTFMVDTGASGTCLHGVPAWRIQRRLRPDTVLPASGIGGSCYYYGERATLIFADERRNAVPRTLNRLDIQVISARDILANRGIPSIPSLIGRDILNHWKFTYDCPSGVMCLIAP